MDEISLPLSLPLDKDGFLRRECPHCGRQFKQWRTTCDEEQEGPEVYYCPYCYVSADANSWYTEQQREYAQQQVMAEVMGPLLRGFHKQIEKIGQSGLLSIKTTSRVPMEPEPLVEFDDMMRLGFPCHLAESIKVDEQWDQEVACTVCGTRYPTDMVRTLSREEVDERLRMEQRKREHPKIFVSHATEDKKRFVIEFAMKLRKSGIDAWVDQWEIRPGDSFVDKIFEVGIGTAQAILVVLSRNSVDRPWVRQELDVSVVQRIERGTKIIPVVLDDCMIPISLQSTLYVRITDLNDYDAELKRVIDAVYGYSNKPALGSAPAYIQSPIEQMLGLTKIDSLLLKMVGDKTIENDNYPYIDAQEMLAQIIQQDISPDQFYESLVILEEKQYLDLMRTSGYEPSDPKLRELTRGGIPRFSITIDGFEKYAKVYIPDYKTVKRDVLVQIVNEGKRDSASIAKAINQCLRVVEHILELLDHSGELRIVEYMGAGTMYLMNPSPQLKRRLENWPAELTR